MTGSLKMPTLLFAILVSFCALLLAPAVSSAADTVAEAGRAVVAKWGDAVVTVKIAVKLRVVVQGKEVENKDFEYEDNGTVVDPAGIIALSLGDIDPSDVLNQFYGGKGNFNATSEVTSLRILLKDGTEIPARIVLRDKDLDIALIAPQAAPANPFVALDLSAAGRPAMLDPVIILTRFGKIANRELAASRNQVQTVVMKPRPYYIIAQPAVNMRTGTPAFTADGKIAGIVMIRRVKPQEDSFALEREMTQLFIVVPAEDIAELAKQATKK